MTDINTHPLITMLEKVAANNPKLREKLDELKAKFADHEQESLDRMARSYAIIKEAVDKLCEDKTMRDVDILYALTSNLVLSAYIYKAGNRAHTRDFLSSAIDVCLDDTDETARENGLHEALQTHKRVVDSGDAAAIKRTEETISKMKFEF